MSSETAFDPDHIVQQLRGQLLHLRSRALIYVMGDPGDVPAFVVQALGEQWQPYSMPEVLLALSYQLFPHGPGLQGFGIWLPAYGSVHLVDTGMRGQVVALGHPSSPPLPEAERVSSVRELRGVLGTLTATPGRRSDPPLLICVDPAAGKPLADAVDAAGHSIDVTDPSGASRRWATASFVFIHHQAAYQVAALRLPPRAAVAILAPRRTARISAAAAALRTDEVLAYPGCVGYLAAMLGRHQKMLGLSQPRPRF